MQVAADDGHALDREAVGGERSTAATASS